MRKIIENKIQELTKLCKLLGVRRMDAFGSVVSGDFNEDSDIDILISFSESLTHQEYADNYFALHYKLRELFGREIDIITERSLSNPYFIESVNRNKTLIYEV